MQKPQNKPIISIVIPIYNVSSYLQKCVDSVLSQSYSNLEIVLVDDGSTDNSGKICDRYAKQDKRVVVVHKKNGGLSDARNAGIDVAKGSYISFIDGDDYVELDYIETLLNAIKNNDSDIAVAGHNIIYPSSTIPKIASKNKVYAPDCALKEILYDREIDLSAWGKLYKTSLFKKIRFPVGRLYEDSATTYKLFDASNSISVVNTAKYNYIIRQSSITNESFNERKYELLASTKEMCDYVFGKYPDLKQACERRMMWAYLSTLTQLAKSSTPKKDDIKRLMSYIKLHRKTVLKDNNIQKRDRFSLYSTYFGFRGFKLAWRLYSKGRK